MIGYELFYGRRRIARVLPDANYPMVFRIHWPDGDVSDMVNLTRAKDAAIAWARVKYPELARREGSAFKWHAGELGGAAPPVRLNGVAGTRHRGTPKNASSASGGR